MKKIIPILVPMLTAASISTLTHAQSGSGAVLEEVVITAQRKSESLQDAAIAVDAAGQMELNRVGITDAKGLSKIAPALTVVSGGGANNVFFVRGVGNFAVNAFTDSALAFNIDNVFLGRPTSTSASFLDVDRIEVLKGPQGTLYGRNATAGAINVIPVKPVLGETSGDLSLRVGNYDTIEASAAINLPLGDKWATRLAMTKVEDNGYNDDGTAATDDMAFRGQVFGELSDRVDLRLAFDYSTVKGTGNAPTYDGNYGFQFGSPSTNPNNIDGYNFNPAPDNVSDAYTGALTSEAEAYYASLPTTPAFTSPYPQRDPSIDNKNWGITAELNIDLGFGDLTVIPAYREAEQDTVFINPGFQAAIVQDDQEQTSLEVRFATSTGPIDWILGAYYFDEEVEGLASYNQQSVQSTTTINASTSESTALFARGTFNVTDEFRLVGAVRWTDDKKTFDGVANSFLNLCTSYAPAFPGGPAIPNCAGGPAIPAGATVEETLAQIDPADLPFGAPGIGTGPVPYGSAGNLLMINPTPSDSSQTSEEITYRIAAEYDITPDSLLYISYETGYRSGGFSLANGHEQYDPEFLDAFTLGSKNRFLDNRLQLNAEVFYWEYEDQQASHLGIDTSGNNAFFTENIGSSTIQGIELDMIFMATESTRLRGNLQYLKNEIDEYSYIQPTPDPAVKAITGCSTDYQGISGAGNALWEVDCAGKEGRNSPEWSASLGIDQKFEIAGLQATFSLDARYRDERWIGFEYTPKQRADSVTTYDATLGLESGDGKWSAMAYARNFTNEDVPSLTQVLGNMSNLVSTVYEPPRTYGVRFNYYF
ncbi:TonB-dependent receptor [Aestuariicella hydrocarbonica]|uniref:TonB-dependent receptor n=1 Tax=Pseudomaricurvus hydrocarbonicus TaxID=1470433 RepID=A0A9E5MNA8_9GAMM|nr:TonB-dependent receptor [Aestuariicella hydrocarbonica]NHO67375.1 TonB-dependent receptor [Aestuariicella hydrocarbonica]